MMRYSDKKESIFIKNIYYMLAFAYQVPEGKDFTEIGAEEFKHIYDLYARILERGMVSQVKRGLYKEYQEKEEATGVLRGRIEMNASIQKQMIKNRKMLCRFDSFTEDCEVNRILKSTGAFLITREEVKKENKEALKRVLLRFSEVKSIAWREISWDKVRLYRNNSSYEMLLYLCRCVMERALFTEEKGEKKGKDYWEEQNLPKLFEKFVLGYYKQKFSEYKPASKRIRWDTESESGYLPNMQTDVKMVYKGRSLIIDTKFYKNVMQKYYEKETIHSANLYQIYSYVKNEDKENKKNIAGVLLYAKTIEGKDLEEEYLIGGSKIGIMTIDLGVDFWKIEKRLNEIVEKYLLKEI